VPDLSYSCRVLVTGSFGFVGRYLVPALAAALPDDAEVIAAVNGSGKTYDVPKVRTIMLDVTSPVQVRDAIAETRPTHLFHLAAVSTVHGAKQSTREIWDVNFGGALNVALAIQETAPECRLIQCSSALVYGSSFATECPADEHAPLCPDTVYGASKAAADLMVGQMARAGLRAVRLRPFNHTGPGQSEGFVVPSFAAQIARIERGQQEPVMHVGGLDNRRDFLDVRDVVEAYIKTVLHFDTLPNGCVINIASGRTWTIRDVLETMLARSQTRIEIVQDEQRMRISENSTMIGSWQVAHKLLGWSPQIDFSSTLAAVLDHWRRA
jgi:GDP-4-dehydro-6-deoxy-D-mannose reductase